MNKRKAFTLIELLLVVAILGALASVLIPRISSSKTAGNQAACDTNVANLIRALELRAMDNSADYPADQTEFDAEILNNKTYFPHGAPTCPEGDSYVYNATDKTVTSHSH